jgi:C-terminal processing protease CtpA/Prc
LSHPFISRCITDTARVIEITPGSSADGAGLHTFDRISAVNGEPLMGPLSSAIAAVPLGGTLELTIERPPAADRVRICAAETARVEAMSRIESSWRKAEESAARHKQDRDALGLA